MKRRLTVILFVCTLADAFAADPMKLTLPEAVRMALAKNHELKIARLKVQEMEQKKAGNKADYFPKIKNESTFLHTTSLENIEIPRGAFGSVGNAGMVPAHDVLLDQGNQTFETVGTSAAQPLTPLIRIRQANRIAASEVAATRDELKKAENEVAVKVHQVYYGILTAQLQRKAAEQDREYARTRLRESQEDVRNGSALNVDVIDGQAGLLQSEQSLLTIDLRESDLDTELNDLLGLPLDTRLVLSPVEAVAAASTYRARKFLRRRGREPGNRLRRRKGRTSQIGCDCSKIGLYSGHFGFRPAELSKRCAVCGPQLWNLWSYV